MDWTEAAAGFSWERALNLLKSGFDVPRSDEPEEKRRERDCAEPGEEPPRLRGFERIQGGRGARRLERREEARFSRSSALVQSQNQGPQGPRWIAGSKGDRWCQ